MPTATSEAVDLKSIVGDLSAIPRIDIKSIVGDLSAMPRIDIKSIVGDLSAMPRIDIKSIVGDLSAIPRADVKSIVGDLSAMPRIDIKSIVGDLSAMSGIDVTQIVAAFTRLQQNQSAVVLEQFRFGLAQAANAQELSETLLQRALRWWLALTPRQQTIQNSFTGAVLAACWLVHTLQPSRDGEVILRAATLLLALLVLLTALDHDN